MQNNNPKILLLVSSFPNYSETFIAAKFVELIKVNPMVNLHCDKFNLPVFNRVFSRDLQKRIKNNILIGFASHGLATAIPALFFLLLRPSIWATLAKYKNIGLSENILSKLKCLIFDLKIIDFQPQIIHFEFATLILQRHYINQILKSKLIISFRGYDANIFPLTHKENFSIIEKKVSGVHVLSLDLKRKVQSVSSFKNITYYKIPPAVKILKTNPVPSKDNDNLCILSVGRLEWKKGYEHFIEAASMLKGDNLKFRIVIIGQGPYFEAISFAIHQFQLEDRIEIKEDIPFDQMHEYYQCADIFVHPSLTEGFCNSVLEAQSYGIPVVCTNVGGLPENISNNKTGYLVPAYSSTALYERIAFLIKNPGDRMRLGRNGIERVRQKFDQAFQIKKFTALYQDILNNG